MFRRRGKKAGDATESDEAASTTETVEPSTTGPSEGAESSDTAPTPTKPPRPHGPWDVSELDGSRPSHTLARLDLGGLRVRPATGMKVQMQVDQATGKATSVLLMGDQAGVQLMAIAAAKTTPLWPSAKRALQADADRRGGSSQDGKGPWGPVLRMTIPVTTPDGKQGVTPSVVLGVDGPRWMLRATMIGRAAIDQEQMNTMMGIVQDTVVVRGEVPMAPGEVITLTPPTRPDMTPQDDESS